ncbi:fibronectin type III domain-containing protein [Jatrophihabitans sp. GAS493]|uniref:fibronectin type III domain-containing protein n=1 Tax=Jatrophihabitans sp. GAS493 TaxID=1907575 RepID=UPI000BB9AB15|nr:fibronectin type III domain-containing protein [Jatrophihabitans sp. GAS493]
MKSFSAARILPADRRANRPRVDPGRPSARSVASRAVGLVTTSAVIAGLGAAYAAPASAAATPPAFVQQVSTHLTNKTSVTMTPTATLGDGNRLIVEVGVWSAANATASTITDSAGNVYRELVHTTAADHTEMSVWTAPITAGAGTKPVITVKATGTADIGAVALEYSGLAAAGATAVDQSATKNGLTTAAATVSSSATPAVTGSNEFALGFYVDSGFGATLGAGAGFTQRANVSPNGDMQMLVEDAPVAIASTPAAATAAGKNTYWQMATIVFNPAQTGPATAPSAPTGLIATAGDSSASLSWGAPNNGGSPITSYTVTPKQGTTALTPISITGTPTTATIPGLTNGQQYSFDVTATNSVGTGPAATSNAVTPVAAPGGSWAPLRTWPIMPLATHLLYNGKTISWDGWQQPQPSVVWDPANPTVFTTINPPDSIFCDGAASLPDGRLLVIGGYGGLSTGQLGIVDTNIFDPASNTWSRVADMNYPRWYPTVTELADGRYLAVSGNSSDTMTWADTPEVYDPASNTWTLLPGVNTSSVHEEEYPFSYEVPSGDVFVMGPEEDNSHLLNVANQTWTNVGSSGLFNGSSVMYRPGKILYSGGAPLIDAQVGSKNNTAVVDLNAATPTWRQTAPMAYNRIYHNLTMLADGTVLAVGGSATSDQTVITTGVLPTEIWNPTTETWTTGASMAAARNYHSTSVLLPDATVLVSGGGHSEGLQNPGQYSSQIYSPAYLSQGPRPTITSASASATYGDPITVNTPDAASITAVNLVSLGADTHQIDMNQHFVPLNFTAGSGSLNVTAPASGTIAPPGYYMLFILKNGVPSIAKFVHIGAATAQTVPGTVTGTVAVAGNKTASVQWNAPTDGGAPITSYQVTPYIGTTAQDPVLVSGGNPVATSTTVTGLSNGTTYTFKVAATNAVGTGPSSTASNAVTPASAPAAAFVQKATGSTGAATSVSVTPGANVAVGDRMLVQVSVWNAAHTTASGVTDSAGNVYTELTHKVASDGTEMSVWSAPVTAGGVRPSITATVGSTADIGITALEYSGLSTAAGSGSLDTSAQATGTTSGAASVSSGATAAASSSGELAVGFYADSGFGSTLVAGSGWTQRANVSPNNSMQLLAQDQSVAAGATANSTSTTGANTIWLAATLVFKSAVSTPPTAPAAPTAVSAIPGNSRATVSWTAPNNGGSPITGYTVTPYIASAAQPSTPVAAGSTSTTINSLINGTSYTFRVTATNAIGTSLPSSASNSVVPTAVVAPAFVQQTSAQSAAKTSLTVTPSSSISAGNRLIVQVGVWSADGATTSAVKDAAGNTYSELLHFTASDGTEMSVWSAPVTAGSGTKPVITATTTKKADIGVGFSEYSGLAATSPVDVTAQAAGTTTANQAVSSGATPATTQNGLAIGFYADSGFSTTPTADPGYTARVNLAKNGNMDLLTEDASVAAGATPGASAGTQAKTIWLMATIVFKSA